MISLSRVLGGLAIATLLRATSAGAEFHFDVEIEDIALPPPTGPVTPVLPEPRAIALDGLPMVPLKQWDEGKVRHILQTFAWAGQASDTQIRQWAGMHPRAAIVQMLDFQPINRRLSGRGPDDPSSRFCHSLERMQSFWSSDDAENPMRFDNRAVYATLNRAGDRVSPVNLFQAWSRMMHTPGCNPFAHRMALYVTNYHAAIHVQNAGPALMRSYYDDVVAQLASSPDFVALMNLAASHAALSRAYGHMGNYFDEQREFHGNDDFAREYFQLLFGIQGTTEDETYHEDVTIEHNAWLLTGMILDLQPDAWGSQQRLDWFMSPIIFANHRDAAGRFIPNYSVHYRETAFGVSCLEILHQPVCGDTAADKLRALGPIAAAHPESMASVPLKLVRFFGDDRLDLGEMAALQSAWADAEFDLLAFLRAYAISAQFLAGDAVKLRSAFDRNLAIHNANQLTGEEAYAERASQGPFGRMAIEGAVVFAPIRDVFGGQTGNDAANDRFLFKRAWDLNVLDPNFLADASEAYQLARGGREILWRKDWRMAVPADQDGQYRADTVGAWLWNHFIGDGGVNYDPVARAQVHALLATGLDFGVLASADNPEAVFSTHDLAGGALAELSQVLGQTTLDLSRDEGNSRVGMAVNFITALPFSFATGGQ